MLRIGRFKLGMKKLFILLIVWVYLLTCFFIIKSAMDRSSRIRDNGAISTTVSSQNERTEIRFSELNTLIKSSQAGTGKTVDVIAVLVLVCDRLTLKRTLDQLMKLRPSPSKFPIIVSQDCGLKGNRVKSLVKQTYGKSITYLTHPFYEATRTKVSEDNIPAHMQGYYHIAAHYGWALNYTFGKLGYDNVIIVEDDLDIAPDFFQYFEATLPILKSDPTLWCVSSYNDNGKSSLIDESRPDLLHRTDFFPGLGWMIVKSLWEELNPKWPDKFWDDWMRDSKQRKGRACIHPEISRTKTFGRTGTSNGQFFDEFLAKIALNHEFVPFKSKSLSYLRKTDYDKIFLAQVATSVPVATLDELRKSTSEVSSSADNGYQLKYRSPEEFTKIADEIGIMSDFKDGCARNSYLGIVPFMFHGQRVYLVPSKKTDWW